MDAKSNIISQCHIYLSIYLLFSFFFQFFLSLSVPVGSYLSIYLSIYVCSYLSIYQSIDLELEEQFAYFGSNILSTKKDVKLRLANAQNPVDRLSIMRKIDLSDIIKRDFFQKVAGSILLYRRITQMLTKRTDKKAK